MTARIKNFFTIMTAKAANGSGITIPVWEYRNCIVSIGTSGTSTLTAKCQWAIGESSPTFSSAATPTNMRDYVEMYDLEDWSAVDGDTWFAVAWADDVKQYEININALDFVTFIVSWYTGGAVTIAMRCTDNT